MHVSWSGLGASLALVSIVLVLVGCGETMNPPPGSKLSAGDDRTALGDEGSGLADPAVVSSLTVSGLLETRSGPILLNPTLSLPVPASASTGTDVEVELFGVGGDLLSAGVGPLEGFTSGDEHRFSVMLPHPGEPIESIVVDIQGVEAQEFFGSLSIPAITVIEPLEGAVVSGDELRIAWAVSDKDDQAVSTVSIFFSADDGLSWRSVASDLSSTELLVEVRRLTTQSTSMGRILVSASDGVNATHVISGSFSLLLE